MGQIYRWINPDGKSRKKGSTKICVRVIEYRIDPDAEQSGKEARQIALDLHKKGVYPSESRVSELMSMPGHLRYKKVRAVLQEVQRELGKLS